MRIAVDVMGADHGAAVVIDGARLALSAFGAIEKLLLVGNEDQIRAHLKASGFNDPRLEVRHASQVLTMDDKPVDALRKKKDCSIARAIEAVKNGDADAIVSPGNTGGILSAGTIRLRTLTGISRGAIATIIPEPQNEFVLLDAGANVECKPLHLAEFAVMGSIYAREILGKPKPRVGVLANGTEESKGNELTQEANRILRRMDLNFIGNVEGHDLFHNHVDVVVCDGFVGNIVLKTCESMARGMFSWLKAELTANARRKLGAYIAKDAFQSLKKRLDSENYGGAPLLGLNGVVMKAHASASPIAIMNAIRTAKEAISHNVNDAIVRDMAKAADVLSELSEAA
jgi:glycerol-3-phosphate acyltransferase PlsX